MPKEQEDMLIWVQDQQANSTVGERMSKISAEGDRIYSQQEKILPTLHFNREPDPNFLNRLQSVGQRVSTYEESRKIKKKYPSIKKSHCTSLPDQGIKEQRILSVVDLNSFNGENESDCNEQEIANEEFIEAMVLDQEYDTTGWGSNKVKAAIDTLFEVIENSDSVERRTLATKMLLRLQNNHEDGMKYIETNLPIIMNKAFRKITLLTNCAKIYHNSILLGKLSHLYVKILSIENAVGRCIICLTRELEISTRIIQHQWRKILFEREFSLQKKKCDRSIRARLRVMNLIQESDLRHHFKTLRAAMGNEPLPSEVLLAYIKIIFDLTQPISKDADPSIKNHIYINHKRLLNSGTLIFLAAYLSLHHDIKLVEMIKAIFYQIVRHHDDMSATKEVLESNIIQRLCKMVERLMELPPENLDEAHQNSLLSNLKILRIIAENIALSNVKYSIADTNVRDKRQSKINCDSFAEDTYQLNILQHVTSLYFMKLDVLHTLLRCLKRYLMANDRQAQSHQGLDTKTDRMGGTIVFIREVLNILSVIPKAFGFNQFLTVLVENAGRALEYLLICLKFRDIEVLNAAMKTIILLTSQSEGRASLTSVGAVPMLLHLCKTQIDQCDSTEKNCFVLVIISIALLSKQSSDKAIISIPDIKLSPQNIFNEGLEHSYRLLLELVWDVSPQVICNTANYILSTGALPTLLSFLLQVKLGSMQSEVQNALQRTISCIVLGRLLKDKLFAQASFSETLITHFALSLQYNQIDISDGSILNYSAEDQALFYLGSIECCKGIGRLSRCNGVTIHCSLASTSAPYRVIPNIPSALVCDILVRLRVLQDIRAFIAVPLALDQLICGLRIAAIDLVCDLVPVPYGEKSREEYMSQYVDESEKKFTEDMIMYLVVHISPTLCHVFLSKPIERELLDSCCTTLSRLAANGAACNEILKSGCMSAAISHFPQVPGEEKQFQKRYRRKGIRNTVANIDSITRTHIDSSLLDIPASLYYLMSKLCSVPEGRVLLMKSQILVRIFKRLQLQDFRSKRIDLDCKCRIMILITRLALMLTSEGSSSELLLHFHIIEVMMELIVNMQQEIDEMIRDTKDIMPHKDITLALRIIERALESIAILSQDIVVCVPKIVELHIVQLADHYLEVRSTENKLHSDTMQYHAIKIIHAIASYPLGQYIGYLIHYHNNPAQKRDLKQKKLHSDRVRLLDNVQAIAHNFSLELKARLDPRRDPQSIGELAREILELVERYQTSQQIQSYQKQEGLQQFTQKQYQERNVLRRYNSPTHVGQKQLIKEPRLPELSQSPVKSPINNLSSADLLSTKSLIEQNSYPALASIRLYDTRPSDSLRSKEMEDVKLVKNAVTHNSTSRSTDTIANLDEKGHYLSSSCLKSPPADKKKSKLKGGDRLMLDPIFQQSCANDTNYHNDFLYEKERLVLSQQLKATECTVDTLGHEQLKHQHYVHVQVHLGNV